MQALPIISTGAHLTTTPAFKPAAEAIPTMIPQMPSGIIASSLSGPIPAAVVPTSVAVASSVASFATTLSTRIQPIKPSGTSDLTRIPSSSSIFSWTTSVINSTTSWSSGFATPLYETGVPAPSDTTNSVWKVDGATGTKFIIYGLFGFFFGVFILAILIDMKRRPDEVKDTFRSIGHFLRQCPKAGGRCIRKNICGCALRRKASKSKPNLSLDRQFEHAAIIERLAAKVPTPCLLTEKPKDSEETFSNTIIGERSSRGEAPPNAVVATEETTEQSHPADPANDTEQSNAELVSHDGPDLKEHPVFARVPSRSSRRAPYGVRALAELEATPVEPHRPASSHYSVAMVDKEDEESEKREPETIEERDEMDYRSWDEWEADLLATVRSP